ncbi:mCG142645, partial [Mus musculus]
HLEYPGIGTEPETVSAFPGSLTIYIAFDAWSLHGSLWGRWRNTLVSTDLVRVLAAWLSRGSRSAHWRKFKNRVKDHDCCDSSWTSVLCLNHMDIQ